MNRLQVTPDGSYFHGVTLGLFNPDVIRDVFWAYGELMHHYWQEDVATIEAYQMYWKQRGSYAGRLNS